MRNFIKKKSKFTFMILVVLLALIIILCSTMGAADIGFLEALRIVTGCTGNGSDETHKTIINNIRMPRIFLATLIGIGLSVVGTTFQGLFKNPMADPYVLGISSGAALGATIAIMFSFEGAILGFAFNSFGAFIGAILTVVLVLNLSKVGNRLSITNMLLSGLAISFFMSSMISILMILNRNQIEKIIFWIMGSVSTASWNQVYTLAVIITIGMAVICTLSRELNIISLGEEDAVTLGVDVEMVKKTLLVVCAIVTAVCVSLSGIIGFVGIIIPNMARILIGSDYRKLLPFSAVIGGIFLVACDTVSRTIMPPVELPVGAITALVGSPFFIYLIIKTKRNVI